MRGIWKGVNDYVYPNSHKTIECFSAYSIMDHPMTSCGCFEAICAYVPECNGVMIVNREFLDDTPVGMTFSTLAGSVGGGQQTPGFMGCGKVFLTSRKFLFSDGGHKRLIWMPKELKALLAKDLERRFREQDAPDLLDKIADETVATDPKQIRAFMEKVRHPALTMPDLGSITHADPSAPYHHRRQWGRSAPVLGRSKLRPVQHAGKFQDPTPCRRCCARGRAHSD